MCHQKKSNFYSTCNLLNRYLKEKKSFVKVSELISTNSTSGRKSSGSVSPQPTLTLFPELDLNKPMRDHAVLPENAAIKDQMTIFYNGDVFTFDNISSEDAANLIDSAKKCTNSAVLCEMALMKDNAMDMEMLPMARRSSLQRFLETRKDRINSKAPYKTNSYNSKLENCTTKALEDKSWLRLSINN